MGNNYGVSAYDIYETKNWDYSGDGVLGREVIDTPLLLTILSGILSRVLRFSESDIGPELYRTIRGDR